MRRIQRQIARYGPQGPETRSGAGLSHGARRIQRWRLFGCSLKPAVGGSLEPAADSALDTRLPGAVPEHLRIVAPRTTAPRLAPGSPLGSLSDRRLLGRSWLTSGSLPLGSLLAHPPDHRLPDHRLPSAHPRTTLRPELALCLFTSTLRLQQHAQCRGGNAESFWRRWGGRGVWCGGDGAWCGRAGWWRRVWMKEGDPGSYPQFCGWVNQGAAGCRNCWHAGSTDTRHGPSRLLPRRDRRPRSAR